MLTLRLPDGSVKQVPEGTRPRDIAEGIGKRLAQAAVAAKVNGTVVDLDRELPAGEGPIEFQILTDRDPESLAVLRHSCAHVMARAVMRLFPGVQLAFGPPIENGFYYDIDVTPPLREEDFPRIEEEMRKIIQDAEPFERFERPTAEARALVGDLGQALADALGHVARPGPFGDLFGGAVGQAQGDHGVISPSEAIGHTP